uniref:Apple domain-containing protein n=1 Tax=Alexandrium monilatum TaxID=311494 RepID=A0A7S4S0B3_9DINO
MAQASGSLPTFVDCAHFLHLLGGGTMAAAKKLLAFALGALHALVCVAGISEEPSCDAGGNKTCTSPPGHSVLQRASQLHVHSSSVAEGENNTVSEARVAPSCGDKAPLSWRLGDGHGGTDFFIGTMLQESCAKWCKRAQSRDRAINGCTWSYSKTQCWAEKGMASRATLGDWVSTFLPPPCKKVKVKKAWTREWDSQVSHIELPRATMESYRSWPCVGGKYDVTLHLSDARLKNKNKNVLVRLNVVWVKAQKYVNGRLIKPEFLKLAVECIDSPWCLAAKKDDYLVFDGWGTRCSAGERNWYKPNRLCDGWGHLANPGEYQCSDL